LDKSLFSAKRINLIVLIIIAISGFSFAIIFYPVKPDQIIFPNGAKFAFSIVDDTDGSTIENVKPVYDYLYQLGIITTKTVWALPTNEPTVRANLGKTISDPEYYNFIKELKNKGFEIASHGARGGSTKRPENIHALDMFFEKIGHYPNIHINHLYNRENIYWGRYNRVDNILIKLLYKLSKKGDKQYFSGHLANSEYFWGDIVKENIMYSRNYTFHEVNTLKFNPSMPYHDPQRPYVNFWFSSSVGNNVEAFNELLTKNNIDRLEREGGVCIVYTHFSAGFVKNNKLSETTKKRLKYLASKNGYFAPATEILDYLRKHKKGSINISWREKIQLQLRWIIEKVRYGPY
jgi:hypothetical protein